MSWGPYQKCLILCWFHRGIGFLQLEQPFTCSLRAPTPAVTGSHDIWNVGMTWVWQRQGGTIFIPIVPQMFFFFFCVSQTFLDLFCVLQTFLSPSTYVEVRQYTVAYFTREWDQEFREKSKRLRFLQTLENAARKRKNIKMCLKYHTGWKVSEKEILHLLKQTVTWRQNKQSKMQHKAHYIQKCKSNWNEFWGVGAQFLGINVKFHVHRLVTGLRLFSQDIPRPC